MVLCSSFASCIPTIFTLLLRSLSQECRLFSLASIRKPSSASVPPPIPSYPFRVMTEPFISEIRKDAILRVLQDLHGHDWSEFPNAYVSVGGMDCTARYTGEAYYQGPFEVPSVPFLSHKDKLTGLVHRHLCSCGTL